MKRLIDDETISGKIAKEVFAECSRQATHPEIVREKGLTQITDTYAIKRSSTK